MHTIFKNKYFSFWFGTREYYHFMFTFIVCYARLIYIESVHNTAFLLLSSAIVLSWKK